MSTGKVLSLYMTISDMMREGHRQICEEIECDPNGVVGDLQYEQEMKKGILLVSKKSYDLIEEADFGVDIGMLLENIYVDIDLYDLGVGSLIEIGDVIFEVVAKAPVNRYLFAMDPELPEVLEGNRGLFIMATLPGKVAIDSEVKVLKKI